MRITFDGAPCEVKASCTVRSGGKAGNIRNGRLTYRYKAKRFCIAL